LEFININSVYVRFAARSVVVFAIEVVTAAVPALRHEKLEVLGSKFVRYETNSISR
jgi:hypothetical protein